MERRILVVDDDPATRSAVARLFRHYGWRTIESSNVRGALEHLLSADDGLPDLIVSDVDMPDGGGAELARQIHAQVPEAKGRVIFHSGSPVEPEAHRQLMAVAAAVLLKPDSIALLSRIASA